MSAYVFKDRSFITKHMLKAEYDSTYALYLGKKPIHLVFTYQASNST